MKIATAYPKRQNAHYTVKIIQTQTSIMKTTEKRFRTQWTEFQQRRMEERYQQNRYISVEERDEFAEELGLDTMIVKVYFKNRRAKDRREEKEIDDQPVKRSRPVKRQPKNGGVKKAKAKKVQFKVKTDNDFTFEDYMVFVKENGAEIVPQYYGEKYNPKDF